MQDFIKEITSYKTVAVVSHVRPDGDAIGSQVAVCLWLKAQGVDTVAVNEDEVPANLQWLLGFFPIQKPDVLKKNDVDAFLFVDGNALDRFGSSVVLHCVSKPLFVIDHHPEPKIKPQQSLIDEKATSTCELIFLLFLNSDLSMLTRQAAMAIYTGMMTDTGSFRFDSVNETTHTIIAELLKRGGFKPNEVAEQIYDVKSLNQIQLLGMALQTLQLHEKELASLAVTETMFKATQTDKADTEGLVAYPLSVKGIRAAAMFIEMEGRIKISLRSRSDLDANEWAKQFGGGGHKKASGAWHPGPLEQAIKDVMEAGKCLVSKDSD